MVEATKDTGFILKATDGAARAGEVRLAHGVVRTPAFMPVGTCASVKGLTNRCIDETGADIILGNVYHLMLRPGAERVAKLGGLRAFMNRSGPILTDSGGFQVMSLSGLTKITEQGALFASHLDGSKHMLSPERSIEVQRLLDSDVTMVLDQCVRLPAAESEVQAAAERSMRWAERSKAAFTVRPGYQLFGIVQGGLSESLRRYSAEGLRAIGFDGYAVGGLAVGEGQEAMFQTLDFTVPMLPEHKPRYLMGVGKPSDIVGAVARGIDMFDCVLPSRSGRNGQAFTSRGALNLRNARFAEDLSPLDSECACRTCVNHSRAYLHHLVRSGEMTAGVLLTLHNLSYYVALTRRLRAAIEAGTFMQTAALMKEQWQKGLAGELTAC